MLSNDPTWHRKQFRLKGKDTIHNVNICKINIESSNCMYLLMKLFTCSYGWVDIDAQLSKKVPGHIILFIYADGLSMQFFKWGD